MATTNDDITLEIDGRDLVVTSPSKLLIPDAQVHKLDLVNYYVAVAEGALRGRRRATLRAGALPQRYRRRVLLPEARAGQAA